jgi:hypothetical protein
MKIILELIGLALFLLVSPIIAISKVIVLTYDLK